MFSRIPCAPELGMELSVGVGELRSTVGNFPSLFSEQKADKKGGGFPGLLLGGGASVPISHSPSETVPFPFCNSRKCLPSQAISLGTSVPKTGPEEGTGRTHNYQKCEMNQIRGLSPIIRGPRGALCSCFAPIGFRPHQNS